MQSLSRVAEGLVRAGAGDTLNWHDVVLSSHFQPIFAVRSASCTGFEALIRPVTAAGRVVRPEALFAEAVAAGDNVLLDWICRALHLRSFARVDPGDRSLFINVHPEAAVKESDGATDLDHLIRYYGLTPRRLCVEILEDGCSDEGLLREAAGIYRQLGVRIAMDDFGLGRSNFDRLVALRPDVVKIDRSILIDAVGDSKARRLLPGIIELLHESGALVAIEGIESANEALIAIDSGADLLQGYHFAPPSAALAAVSLSARMLGKLVRMSTAPAPLGAVGDD